MADAILMGGHWAALRPAVFGGFPLPLRSPSTRSLLRPLSSRDRLHVEAVKLPTRPSAQARQPQLQNPGGLMISQGLGGIRTHANDTCICGKEATALAERPPDRRGLFPGSQISPNPFTGAPRASLPDSSECVHSCCAIWTPSNLLN